MKDQINQLQQELNAATAKTLELTNEIDSYKSQLSELTNQVENLKQQREAAVDDLENEKVSDLGLDVNNKVIFADTFPFATTFYVIPLLAFDVFMSCFVGCFIRSTSILLFPVFCCFLWEESYSSHPLLTCSFMSTWN